MIMTSALFEGKHEVTIDQALKIRMEIKKTQRERAIFTCKKCKKRVTPCMRRDNSHFSHRKGEKCKK